MKLTRHTHRSGTDFSVWFDGGARDGELIWTSKDWEHETDFQFPAPIRIPAGEGFKFACGFRNDGDQPLRFGTSAQDEMCILFADIWSPTPQRNIGAATCTMTWVDGQGIARDAKYPGRPKPEVTEVLSCNVDILGLSLLSGCLGCICDKCATPWTRCMADADCKPILECNSGCLGGGASLECQQTCEPVIFEHSSAVGMATSIGTCIQTECNATCTAESASGMAPPSP